MSKPPKVKPYDPYHLVLAERFMRSSSGANGKDYAKTLATMLAQEHERGWNKAMYQTRKVVEAITLSMSPNLFNWTLRRAARELTKKEKKT